MPKFKLLTDAYNQFSEDRGMEMAAAIAYYTIFSLPPLLVIAVSIAGLFLNPQDISQQMTEQLGNTIGSGAAGMLSTMLQHASQPGRGILGTIIGILILLIGASGVMIELQSAMNQVWDVEPDPNQGGIKNFFAKRLLSFAMVLGIAFLLLVSLVLTTALSLLGNVIRQWLSSELWVVVFWIANALISFGIIVFLFGAMFKILPDAKIRWRDVLLGAALTALLFMIGRYLISLYLSSVDVGSTYGAAGSLVLIMVWIYYSAMIFLLGAGFTKVWAVRHGRQIEPKQGAVRIEKTARG